MFKGISTRTRGYVYFFFDDEDEDLVENYQWSITEKNQIISSINRQVISLPRLLLKYHGDLQIDHIDRNRLNNHKYNLRLATPAQNLQNRDKFKTYGQQITTSKYKGVTYLWNNNCWKSQIGYKGNVVYLGCYDTEIEAALAYNYAASILFGEFAKLNDIPTEISGEMLKTVNAENLYRLIIISSTKMLLFNRWI